MIEFLANSFRLKFAESKNVSNILISNVFFVLSGLLVMSKILLVFMA